MHRLVVAILRYVPAAVALGILTAGMIIGRAFVEPFVSPPFLLLTLLVAWFVGVGPAIFVGAGSIVILDYCFIPPVNAIGLGWRDAASVAVFAAVAIVMAALTSALRRSRDDLAHALEREAVARGAAEAADRSKDEFLAILGHELRSPLSAITASVRVLARLMKHDEAASRSCEIIEHQVEHVARMVDDVLSVNRILAGRIVLDRRPFDFADAVARSVASISSRGKLEGYVFSFAADEVTVDGDPVRLEQVAVNLLDNAVKYTPPGGSIDVTVRSDVREAVLVVRDSGIGIASETLPRIFELFVQADARARRGQDGLGIGLAVVRRLVELHGGSVSVASDGPGRGTTFTVRLPRLPRAAMMPA